MLMAATERKVVIVENIRSFSVVPLGRNERKRVLQRVNKRIQAQRDNEEKSQVDPWWLHLRDSLRRGRLTVELDRREHTRLQSIVERIPDSESMLERLREAQPGCRWCEDTAMVQLRLGDSDPVLICGNCIIVVETSHGYRLLQDIDPTIAPATKITINDSDVLYSSNRKQTFLSSYTGADVQSESS